jgi:hypothetical protein
MAACMDGMLFVTDLKVGNYVFRATLNGGAAPIVDNGVMAMVTADQVASADAIDFPTTAASTLQVTWTVNGGMHCPAGTMVTADALLGGTVADLQMIACSNYQATLTGLAPGSYTVDVSLTSGTMTAMGERQNVMVQMGANTVGPIDITCSFCP